MTTNEQADQLELAAKILRTGHPFEAAPKPNGLWAKPIPHERDIMKWPLDKWEIRIVLATPPDGRPLHNPDNLTAEQVGVGKRLTVKGDHFSYEAEVWNSARNEWRKTSADFFDSAYTYRLPLSVPWPEPEPEPEPESFQLPPPPPGVQWHRKDGWKAEFLPKGYRPLCADEATQSLIDEYRRDLEVDNFDGQLGSNKRPQGSTGFWRTTRPLTFSHLGKTWTWHKPGDPMPCDGDSHIHIICHEGRTTDRNGELYSPRLGLWNMWNRTLGWRYAEPSMKTVDLGPEDVPPGSALRLNTWDVGIYVTPSVWRTGVSFAVRQRVEDRTYEQIKNEGWQINRSIPLTGKWNPDAWEPCSKQIPA